MPRYLTNVASLPLRLRSGLDERDHAHLAVHVLVRQEDLSIDNIVQN